MSQIAKRQIIANPKKKSAIFRKQRKANIAKIREYVARIRWIEQLGKDTLILSNQHKH